MARCEIVWFTVTEGGHGPTATMRAAYRCEVHGMPVDSLHLPGSEMCAIGKIEAATEAALAKIAAALPHQDE